MLSVSVWRGGEVIFPSKIPNLNRLQQFVGKTCHRHLLQESVII